MGLRPEVLWHVSFWVAFHGSYVELVSTVGPNVGIRSRGLVNPEQTRVKTKVTISKVKIAIHVVKCIEH
jgi:hypothetical protein